MSVMQLSEPQLGLSEHMTLEATNRTLVVNKNAAIVAMAVIWWVNLSLIHI